jgi:hypothetical protein
MNTFWHSNFASTTRRPDTKLAKGINPYMSKIIRGEGAAPFSCQVGEADGEYCVTEKGISAGLSQGDF